jgi:hypothetical protein
MWAIKNGCSGEDEYIRKWKKWAREKKEYMGWRKGRIKIVP